MFLTQKPITLKGRSRSGGGFPSSSSLPQHDAKDRTGQIEKNQKRNKKDQG